MAIKIELNQLEVGNLDKRFFDSVETSYLGKYVYALRDPRDRKIFYVGQGAGNRIFEHFAEAEDVVRGNKNPTSKTLRIIDIWISGKNVDWLILARNLSKNKEDKEADKVESAVLNALQESQNGPCLNQNGGPNSTLTLPEDLVAIKAPSVNPLVAGAVPHHPYYRVFVFNISKSLERGEPIYQATRGLWTVVMKNRTVVPRRDFGVGLVRGISHSSYEIASWAVVSNPLASGKCEFDSTPAGFMNPIFLNMNWVKIINSAKTFMFGKYLIVEFDGQGNFRVTLGAGPNSQWQPC